MTVAGRREAHSCYRGVQGRRLTESHRADKTLGMGSEGGVNKRGFCVENTVKLRVDHLYEV